MSKEQLPQGTALDFETKKEDWNEYRLSDGTLLKVKLVLTGVVRLNGQFDPAGNPVYAIANLNAVRVIEVPPELRQKSKPNTTQSV